MAVGHVARRDAADREAHDLRRLMRAGERAQDRMQRPDPAQRVGLGRGGAPAHRLRPRKRAQDRRQDFRQHFARRAAFLRDSCDVERAFLRVGLDRRVLDARQSRALEEALDRAVRRADARPLAFLDPARLRFRQADDVQRQPARRGEALRAFVRQARVDQRVGDQPLQILRRLPLHARRDFFAEQFKEQVGHSCVSSIQVQKRRQTLLPPAGEGGAKRRMRASRRIPLIRPRCARPPSPARRGKGRLRLRSSARRRRRLWRARARAGCSVAAR